MEQLKELTSVGPKLLQLPRPMKPKRMRDAKDRVYQHIPLPPGTPRKIKPESILKLAAAELQRRLGTHHDLSHLDGSDQVRFLLPAAGHLRAEDSLMNAASDFFDVTPPPPPAV